MSGGAGKLRRGGDTADHSWGGTEGATGGQPPKPAPMLWLTLLPSAYCLTEDAHQLHNFKTTVSLISKLLAEQGNLAAAAKCGPPLQLICGGIRAAGILSLTRHTTKGHVTSNIETNQLLCAACPSWMTSRTCPPQRDQANAKTGVQGTIRILAPGSGREAQPRRS